jgi:hypothetical protein
MFRGYTRPPLLDAPAQHVPGPLPGGQPLLFQERQDPVRSRLGQPGTPRSLPDG